MQSNSEQAVLLHLINLSVLLLIAEASAFAADIVWGVTRDCVTVKLPIHGGQQEAFDAAE